MGHPKQESKIHLKKEKASQIRDKENRKQHKNSKV